uniref:B3 domain-containing transcription factor VRN1-like isoform X1 n=1 Tax=Fragaria vesca subsp. vesca TaxID=101020 RepID=UPI0005CA475E|nr:PREDICTED: B3 domain-containing transcription factor VRN1-like isoform X1 [Fragaria vesca subsp. vesca]
MYRRRERHGRPPFCAPTTAPHFFKFILDDTSRDTKLKLPYKFVKKYGGELSSSASLKLPDGLEWEVDITRCDSKVWFEKGWENFSYFYSIGHGHFLVFGYQGNSKFDVCIFDRTATEIDYSRTVEDDDSSGEILEDCLRGSRNSGSVSRKKNRNNSTGKPEMDDNNDEGDVGSEEGEDEDNHSRRMHPVTSSIRKEIALQRAKDYEPALPHFVIAIRTSSIPGGYLYVPSVFSKTYLATQPTHIMLQTVSNKEPWCVDMHYERSACRLRAGWPGFVKSNKLVLGDACVFVLKDSNAFLFDVVFYRAT